MCMLTQNNNNYVEMVPLAVGICKSYRKEFSFSAPFHPEQKELPVRPREGGSLVYSTRDDKEYEKQALNGNVRISTKRDG